MPQTLKIGDMSRMVLASLADDLSFNSDWARQYRDYFDQAFNSPSAKLIPPLRGMGALLGQSSKIGDTIHVKRPEPEPWNLDRELMKFGLRYTPSK